MAEGTRASHIRTWVGRAAFVASVLALLGTSPARWAVNAKVEGPERAPSNDQALRVTIEASHEPSLARTSRLGNRQEGRGCMRSWSPTNQKIECLLPPGSTLGTIDAVGRCNGGGLCTNEPCKPPPNASIKATTKAVPIWTKTVEREVTLEVPKKSVSDAGAVVTPHLELVFEAIPPTVEITIRKAPTDTATWVSGGWNGSEMEIECLGGEPAAKPIDSATCSFWGLASAIDKKPATVALIVKVLAFGACDEGAEESKPAIDAGSSATNAKAIVDGGAKAVSDAGAKTAVDAGAREPEPASGTCAPPASIDRLRIVNVRMASD